MRAGPAVLDLCEVFPLQMPDLPKHIEDVVSSWGGAPQRRLPTYTTHPHSPVFPVPAGRERGRGWGARVGKSPFLGVEAAAQHSADSKDLGG